MAEQRRRGARWSDLSRGRKYALIQSQVVYVVLVAVVTYLLATNGFVAIALVFVLVQVILFTWMWWRLRGQSRRV
jgi:4-hydroxybenzoate polyprenyltransferase